MSIFPSKRGPSIESPPRQDLVLHGSQEIEVAPSSTEIVASDSSPNLRWKQPDWERLWLSSQRVPWRSLALVPSGNMPPRFTLEIAVSLVYTGSLHLGEPIRMADATNVPLTHLKQFAEELEMLRRDGDRLIVALGPLRDSATAAAIAQAADQSLLCVPLEMSRVSDAKKTIAEIGAKRFIGSAAFHV